MSPIRRARLRLAACASVGAAALGVALPAAHRGETLDAALVDAMAAQGLTVVDGRIEWVDAGRGATREALFLARVYADPADLFACTVRAAGSTVLQVLDVSNLTSTAGAEETQMVRSGDRVAYLSRVRGSIDAVSVVDLRGEDPALTRGWSRGKRLQDAITLAHDTGRFRGFGRARFAIEPASERASLAVDAEGIRLDLDGHASHYAADAFEPALGALRREPVDKGEPGGITWLVDTVRSLSFVGPEPIAWLESRVYGARDRWLRLRARWLPAAVPTEEREAERELAALRVRREARVRELGSVGFPPAPLSPVVSGHEGDGEWLPIVDDPFVGSYPNAAPAFAETTLHVDPDRPFAAVHIVAWDPRQVQLRAVSGTREPESASGAFGTGVVPRDPARLPRLVGAFNGGFQAMHGEFGMMAERVVYLPPKPFAATVAVMADGSVAMGSWVGLPPGARSFTEQAAVAQIPPEMVDFRQNLTSLVEGDRYNPWQRWYWGAANVNATEQTFVDRSALCVTHDGFVLYFWGNSMGPEQVGAAMKRARCDRGMHLDMNAKHTQFEYYRVARGELPPVGRRLGEHEFETAYPDMPDFRVRGRLAVDAMQPQEFPRYVTVEARDFFYLELRPTLPGPDLPGGIRFEVSSLPQPAYPWAFARARAGGVTLIRIDTSRALPAGPDDAAPTVGYLPLGATGDRIVVIRPRLVGTEARVVDEVLDHDVVFARGPAATDASTRAIGVDDQGFVVYAEGPLAGSVLSRAGVVGAVELDGGLAVCDATDCLDAAGVILDAPPTNSRRLVARTAPYTATLNSGVVPVPYAAWGRIQDSRVRYIPTPGPRRFNQGQ